MKKLITLFCVLLLTSCGSNQQMIRNEIRTTEKYDVIWNRAVEWLGLQEIKIEKQDKEKGIIETYPFERENLIECGQAYYRKVNEIPKGRISVKIDRLNDTCIVHTKCEAEKAGGEESTEGCNSTGKFETALNNFIEIYVNDYEKLKNANADDPEGNENILAPKANWYLSFYWTNLKTMSKYMTDGFTLALYKKNKCKITFIDRTKKSLETMQGNWSVFDKEIQIRLQNTEYTFKIYGDKLAGEMKSNTANNTGVIYGKKIKPVRQD